MVGLGPPRPLEAHKHGVDRNRQTKTWASVQTSIHCSDINHFHKEYLPIASLTALVSYISLVPHFSTGMVLLIPPNQTSPRYNLVKVLVR